MSVATLAHHDGESATEEPRLDAPAAPVKVFRLDGASVDVPEQADKTVQFYLDAVDITVGAGDVIYLDGRAVTGDTTVPVDQATHVITVSSEIACG